MIISPWLRLTKLLCVILFVIPLLTGCWDRLEIEERAVVLGISVDVAGPSAVKEEYEVSNTAGISPALNKDMIRVAVQIALPGKIPLGPGESGGGKGAARQTVWVIDVVGRTIDDALMNLQQQVSGRLFFGHLRVIVVSEEVAKKGLQNLNDYFRRNPEVRRMAWLMISNGNAEKLMKAAPELERVPALYLMATLDNAVKSGKFPPNYVGMFWSNSVKKGQEAYLPYVELKKQQNIELKGLAYFKNEEMVGDTKAYDIASFMEIKGMNPAGYRGFIKLEGTSHIVTVYATSRKTKLDVRIRDNHLYFTVSIFTENNMEEKINEQFVVSNSQILKEIEQLNRASVKKGAETLVEEMQHNKSDIFGFGEYVRAKKPFYWNREIKTKEKWQEVFQNINVEITVNSKLRRVGMKAK